MAHNINTYVGRLAAWHALGTVTGKFMTWEEISAHPGLDFLPVKDQLEYHGQPIDAYGTFRNDNGAFLGTVGADYQVIDHRRGFRMVNALMGLRDGAFYETAGVLGKGEVVWGLANLNFSIRVGADDKHDVYLLFVTSHDGSISHVYRITLTRVVCQNTLQVSLGEKSKALFRVRHTKNADVRLDLAEKALEGIEADAMSVEAKLNFLAGRKVTRDGMISILDRLFPVHKREDGTSVDQRRRENILTQVLQRFEINDDNTFPEQRGSAYNLLNAVTEYTDHFRATRKDDNGESAMFGSGEKLKTQAMELITEVAQSMPGMPTHYVSRPVPAHVTGGSTGSLLDSIMEGGIVGRD